MKVTIRSAKESDLPQYTNLLQETYQFAYTNEVIGLTKACFSPEIFNTADTQKYLASNLINNTKQKCWLAFTNELIGSITIVENESDYELRGFYVTPSYQGKGIGKTLWKKVLTFAKGKDITLDIYTHNNKTIETYKRWGFKVDKARGEFSRHWPEWPEGIYATCLFMRYTLT